MSQAKPKRSRKESDKEVKEGEEKKGDEDYKGGPLDLGIPTLKEILKGKYVLYCRGSIDGQGWVKLAPASLFSEEQLHWISTHTMFSEDDLADCGTYQDGLYEAIAEIFSEEKSVIKYPQGNPIGVTSLQEHPPGLFLYEQYLY